MPGLAGIIGPGKPEIAGAMLPQMVECMMHESFYSKGTYQDDQMGIWVGWVAHKNSFADGMPVWNEKKDIGLILSGEDFTDPDEIQSLRSRGHEIGQENASYLVHLYEEFGEAFFGKLNGRFSGVVIDLRLQRIILFNDRYGLNRIYLHERMGTLYFSSEAKSLLKVLPELRRLDLEGLGETFTLGCVLQNRTLFPGISLLPGGSCWTFQPIARRKEGLLLSGPMAWNPRTPLSTQEYYDDLKQTWSRILPRYFRGREKVGLSLTGGKDSRMILAYAQSPPETLPCYTFEGPYRESRDIKLAREVARHLSSAIPVDQGRQPIPERVPDVGRKDDIPDGRSDGRQRRHRALCQ